MVCIEGDFSIHPTDDGLLVIRRDHPDSKVWYVFQDGTKAEIVRVVNNYVTLLGGETRIHCT